MVNALGLTIGIICVSIIAIWLRREYSFDRFSTLSERTFRFTTLISLPDGSEINSARTSNAWVGLMPLYFHEIEAIARLADLGRVSIKDGETKFDVSQTFVANEEVLDIFNVNILRGREDQVLVGPNKIVIARSVAEKYFKTIDLVGRQITMADVLDNGFKNYEISGVFEDFAETSHLHPLVLVSIKDNSLYDAMWSYNYLLIKESESERGIIDRFPEFANRYISETERRSVTPDLQKLTDIHLNSSRDREIELNGSLALVHWLLFAAMIVLVMAIVNYVNLSLAFAYQRKRAIAMHRLLGADPMGIYFLLFFESILIFGLGSMLAYIGLPWIFAGFPSLVPLSFLTLHKSFLVWFLLLFTLSSSLLVSIGLYILISKALFQNAGVNLMDSFRPRGFQVRGLLITSQFSLSVGLIICAIYFSKLKANLLSHKLGLNDDPIILVGRVNADVKQKYFEFKSLALSFAGVKGFTGTMQAPTEQILDEMPFSMTKVLQPGEKKRLYVAAVDANFFSFYNIQITEGRNFVLQPSDSSEEYILNESALKFLGIDQPQDVIGNDFILEFPIAGIFNGGKIVGVVDDFFYSTMMSQIHPTVFFQKSIWFTNFLIKIDRTRMPETIDYLRSSWDSLFPDYSFDYTFMDDKYFQVYKKEITISSLFGYFVALSLIIAALGLYSITSLIVEQQLKEIGIRKVLGATTFNIIWAFCRKFTLWICISILIAIPLAVFLIAKWNANYVIHTEISIWNFVFTVGFILLFCWLIVGLRSIRASLTNPITYLREQ